MNTSVPVKHEAKDVAVEKIPALSPFTEIEKRMQEIEQSFERLMPRSLDNLFPQGWLQPLRWELPVWSGNGVQPRVDIVDQDESILVRAELPGVKKEDIDLKITNDSLILKGHTIHSQGRYYRRESLGENFARTIYLPSEVKCGSAKASFQDGVLTVTIPKEDNMQRHTVKISG